MYERCRAHLTCILGLITGLAAAVTFAADMAGMGELYRASTVGLTVAAVLLLCQRRKVDVEVLERARQGGYDAGFRDGRTTTRPVVVPINSVAVRDASAHHFGH